MGCGISAWDLGFETLDDIFMIGVWDLLLGIWDLGTVILGFGTWGLGFRVWGLEFGVKDLG